MAVGKEIRGKIKSVENTKKITKAMEMVAASKMRKAQERMRAARPTPTRSATSRPTCRRPTPSTSTPTCATTDAKAVGFIVVTTDKGLCGGLNTNVLRAVTNKMRDVQAAGGTIQAVAIGNKGFGFLNRIGANVCQPRRAAGRRAAPRQADRPGQGHARRLRRAGKLDAVYLCYTRSSTR
jgi:F-type H+-transporting ATPase subunit gamma